MRLGTYVYRELAGVAREGVMGSRGRVGKQLTAPPRPPEPAYLHYSFEDL